MAELTNLTVEIRVTFLTARERSWRERLLSGRPWERVRWEITTPDEMRDQLDEMRDHLDRFALFEVKG